MTETNRARNVLYQQLMQVPHRDYAPAVTQFRAASNEDPDFVMRACVYLASGNTKIRDQEDISIITLLQSPPIYPWAREAGRVLLLGSDFYEVEPGHLHGMPPFRIIRVLQFVAQSDRKVPRLAKSLATDYVRGLEDDNRRFDGVVIRNRKGIKWLYTNYHIRPNDRADDILFKEKMPENSILGVLKQIANSTNVNEQARLVIEHKIPYRVAISVLPKMNPVVGVALIDAMSPTEALNSRSWVERSGLLEIPEVKDTFVAKVSQATSSIASAEHRTSAQGQDADVQAAVEQAKQTAVEQAERIEGDVLLIVDRSGSMQNAIATAIEFGARIAPLCDGEIMVVTHNTFAQEIVVTDKSSLSSWQQAFVGIRANGGTNMQRALELALERGFMPQKIVLVTDGGENSGSFRNTVERYAEQGVEPTIVQITVDNNEQNYLSRNMNGTHLRYDQFVFTGDYYVFDQVTMLLGGPPAKSLVEKILEVEFPRRRTNRKEK